MPCAAAKRDATAAAVPADDAAAAAMAASDPDGQQAAAAAVRLHWAAPIRRHAGAASEHRPDGPDGRACPDVGPVVVAVALAALSADRRDVGAGLDVERPTPMVVDRAAAVDVADVASDAMMAVHERRRSPPSVRRRAVVAQVAAVAAEQLLAFALDGQTERRPVSGRSIGRLAVRLVVEDWPQRQQYCLRWLQRLE